MLERKSLETKKNNAGAPHSHLDIDPRHRHKDHNFMYVGIITIEILSAHFTRNTEMFSLMDPFVEIDYNSGVSLYRTTVLQEAGQSPIWDEYIEIPIESMEGTVKFTCFDEDLT
jgi:Ca2+-dependent lipid-binding protein